MERFSGRSILRSRARFSFSYSWPVLALTLFSYGSGAPGGIFAPMLAMATSFSLAFAQQAHTFNPISASLPNPDVLAVAGMGAFVAATVRAPLTAVMLTVEMTGNYVLILPLLLTCLSSTIDRPCLGG